ncbi:hypothetical protein [Bacillus smithii]|uniref:hypothetical protein n=2 Tax=Bacillus smithii TaxID=1479 RepID=UPI00065E4BD8|nr:hypothetical protein [Bacillus smithii]
MSNKRKFIIKIDKGAHGMNLKRLIQFLLLLFIPSTSYIYVQSVGSLTDEANLVITLSLTILFPVLFWLFSKRKILSIFSGFFIGLILAFLIIPSTDRQYFHYILKVAALVEILFLLFVVNSIRLTIKKMKSLKNDTHLDFWERLDDSMSGWIGNSFVRGAVIMEFKTFYYSLIVWFKKPKPPNGLLFKYHEKTMFKTFIIVILLILPLDAVVFHLLFMQWNKLAAWISTIINIYAFFYAIALYNSAKYLPIVVTSNKLIIHSGYTGKMMIDIDNIQSLETFSMKDDVMFTKTKKGVFKATVGIDEPELELKLINPVKYFGPFGIQKHAHTVLFRVDEPQQFNKIIQESMDKHECIEEYRKY